MECLSCQQGNETCEYANAKFSLGKGSYYILECYGLAVPFAVLYSRTGKLSKSDFIQRTTRKTFFVSHRCCQ